jgi:hypothetical protein
MTLIAPQSGGALRDAAGNPVVPQCVLSRLTEINPRLTADYVPSLGTFAVYLRWLDNDSRRVLIQRQEIGDFPFDMLCALPDNVPLDQMHGWVNAQLRRVGQNREDIRRMLDEDEARVAKANAAIVEEKSALILEDVMMTSTKTINVGSRRTKHKVS